jgi:hypothetical protein
MAAALTVEFEGQTREQYERVGQCLGIDLIGGHGNWPDGLLSHAAGPTDRGWSVVEVWASRPQQELFLRDRLRPALEQAGIQRPPVREEWLELAAYHTPQQHGGA